MNLSLELIKRLYPTDEYRHQQSDFTYKTNPSAVKNILSYGKKANVKLSSNERLKLNNKLLTKQFPHLPAKYMEQQFDKSKMKREFDVGHTPAFQDMIRARLSSLYDEQEGDSQFTQASLNPIVEANIFTRINEFNESVKLLKASMKQLKRFEYSDVLTAGKNLNNLTVYIKSFVPNYYSNNEFIANLAIALRPSLKKLEDLHETLKGMKQIEDRIDNPTDDDIIQQQEDEAIADGADGGDDRATFGSQNSFTAELTRNTIARETSAYKIVGSMIQTLKELLSNSLPVYQSLPPVPFAPPAPAPPAPRSITADNAGGDDDNDDDDDDGGDGGDVEMSDDVDDDDDILGDMSRSPSSRSTGDSESDSKSPVAEAETKGDDQNLSVEVDRNADEEEEEEEEEEDVFTPDENAFLISFSNYLNALARRDFDNIQGLVQEMLDRGNGIVFADFTVSVGDGRAVWKSVEVRDKMKPEILALINSYNDDGIRKFNTLRSISKTLFDSIQADPKYLLIDPDSSAPQPAVVFNGVPTAGVPTGRGYKKTNKKQKKKSNDSKNKKSPFKVVYKK